MNVIITKGSSPCGRYTAHDGAGNIVHTFPGDELTLEQKHEQALRAFCESVGCKGDYMGGYVLKGGRTVSRAWVQVDAALHVSIL